MFCSLVSRNVTVLSLGDLVVAKFSVEMSDSSDISSWSRVPVEVAKPWPCSTGVDSLATLFRLINTFYHSRIQITSPNLNVTFRANMFSKDDVHFSSDGKKTFILS